MADSKFGKYIHHHPLFKLPESVSLKEIKGITHPREIFLADKLVKGCGVIIDIGWHFTVPDPDPIEPPHAHDMDTVLCFIGSDPKLPSNLGAVLQINLGDEIHVLTKTCAVFIPKGLKHNICAHQKVDRPFVKIEIALD